MAMATEVTVPGSRRVRGRSARDTWLGIGGGFCLVAVLLHVLNQPQNLFWGETIEGGLAVGILDLVRYLAELAVFAAFAVAFLGRRERRARRLFVSALAFGIWSRLVKPRPCVLSVFPAILPA